MSQQHDNTPPAPDIQLLTPGEVAVLYRVDAKTVTRWANRGHFTTYRTPGGHRRFHADEVFATIAASSTRREVRS